MKLSLNLAIAFISLILWVTPSANAQYWMQMGGSITVDEGMDIAVDGSGNTYTTGYFTGTIAFGSNSLSSSGNTDIFVVKTDDEGVYQWAVKAGGSGSDRGLSINTDASGNVYVCGYFNGTASFGTTSLVSSGLRDAFIAKYNTSGVLQWVVKAGGSAADAAYGITADGSGNVIVTGEFKDSATFGSTTLASLNGSSDVFVSKLNSSGVFQWTKHGKGNFTDRGIDVDVDNSGNVYVVGQFSDTITFDQQHNNQMFNVIFLIKFSSSGSEQWFRIAGAATSNIANSIATDASGNSYITGDFTGNLTFYGSPNVVQNGSADNNVFVAKYNTSGQVQWASSDGSDNDLSARSIAIDGSGNSYIVGHFGCKLDDYSDQYGEAIFNSVGYSDIFAAQYNSSGVWQYSRHVGSRKDDFGNGVAVNSSGEIHFTGSFKADINIPTSSSFLTSNLNLWDEENCSGNSPYCNDPDYGKFHEMDNVGNSDVIIANCFDPDREPHDYYKRSGSACVRDIVNVCINSGCPDTAEACTFITLQAFTNTCSGAGPAFTYQWQGGQNQSSATYATSGPKWVKQTTEDGCFQTADTIEVVINGPDKPTISDDVVVNTNTPFPQIIELCAPDTVVLTGGNFGSNSVNWTGPGLGSGSATVSITTSLSGIYNFSVEDTNGCVNTTSVEIVFFDSLPPFILKSAVPDSIQVCSLSTYQILIYDSVENPGAAPDCFTPTLPYNVTTQWTFTPSIPNGPSCGSKNILSFPDTGMYYFTAMVIRSTPCEEDTHYVSDSVYVEVLPKPVITPFFITINGSGYYCPGESTMLVASGGPNYLWAGTGFNGSTADTVFANTEEWVSVQSTVTDTNQYGCTSSYTAQNQKYIQEKPQPEVVANSLLICPNDSVLLTCTNSGATTGFNWEGPSGPIASNSFQIYVTEPGIYFCLVDDGDSCGLVSNSVELTQYTTPSIVSGGDLYICEGDSVVISVIASSGALIQWQAPLSGDSTSQVITQPGVYTCMIEACSIQTFAEIEVFPSPVEAEIIPDGVLCFGESLVLQGSDSMATYSWWPSGATTEDIVVFDSGNVVLTTTDSNGCEAVSDTVYIGLSRTLAEIDIAGPPVFCEEDSIVLQSLNPALSYQWLPTNDTTASITVFTPGTYQLITTDTNGCVEESAERIVKTLPIFAPVEVQGALALCEGDSVMLTASAGGLVGGLWHPTGDTGTSIAVYETGRYAVSTIDTFGCVANSDTIYVFVEENRTTTPLLSDTTICAGEELTLIPENEFGEIQWSFSRGGEVIHSGSEYSPSTEFSAQYWIWSAYSLCISDYTPFWVNTLDCDNIAIPNVFTPNGDGINDVWRAELEEYTCLECYVYNRWGMLVTYVNMLNTGWDGTVASTGDPAPDGVYYYVVDYCKFNGEQGQQRGDVTLIRSSD